MSKESSALLYPSEGNTAKDTAFEEKKQALSSPAPPLVVDLDGSLIKTELPWESFLSVLSRRPFQLIKIIKNKIQNRKAGYFKIELEKWADLSLSNMPFSQKFVTWLKEEKSHNRKLVLCTGSTQAYADKIQKVTGLFDEVYGSTLGKNLVGVKKARFLSTKYGEKQFDYAGNSLADLKVARYARRFIQVNPSFWASFFAKKITVHQRFMETNLNPSFLAHTLGFPLWFLNCLCVACMLPFLAGVGDFDKVFFALAFSTVHFNFLATAFYVFFSMTGAERARSQPEGATDNPFATGDLSLPVGCLIALSCLLCSVVSLICLSLTWPLTVITSTLYCAGIYLLSRKKIKNKTIPLFIRYLLLILVVLLQSLLVTG